MGWNDGPDSDPVSPRGEDQNWRHLKEIVEHEAVKHPDYFGSYPALPSDFSGRYKRTYSVPSNRWNLYRKVKMPDRLAPDLGTSPFFTEELSLELPESLRWFTSMFGFITSDSEGVIHPCNMSHTISSYIASDVDSFPVFPLDTALTQSRLLAFGTDAIAESLPTLPEVSVGVTLAEAREWLPFIPGSRLFRDDANVKSLGDEWLNYQFGILPLTRDIGDIAEAILNSTKFIEQLRRDNTKLIRRRRTLLEEVEETSETETGKLPESKAPLSLSNASYGTLTTVTRRERKVWFSGAFSYAIPEFDSDSVSRLLDLERTYAVGLSPINVWNTLPYSWLVDWVSNASSVWTNMTYLGRDGLIMAWGYVMAETTTYITYTWTGPFRSDSLGSWQTVSLETTVKSVVKQRLRATPFGFMPDFSGFNPKQLSILAALGVSRLPWL